MAVTLHTAALGTRLDRLPLSPFHRRLVVALAGMILFEWVETYAFAFVAPALREQWDMPLSTVAVVAGVGQLGAFAGGVLAGYLADRVGRRRTMLACVILYCVATVGCVLVQNPWQLIAARTATHLGAQGMAVVAIVVLTEFVPATARGRLQTYKVAIGSLGIPIAAWAGYFLVPQWTWGWRLVFGLGLFGVVFAVLIHRWVPESPRWLASRGRIAEADAIVRRVEVQCGVEFPVDGPPAPAMTASGPTETPDRPRISELWTGAHRRNFLVVTTMWVTGLLAYSAYNTWTPTLLAETGLDLDDTLLLSAALATAAPSAHWPPYLSSTAGTGAAPNSSSAPCPPPRCCCSRSSAPLRSSSCSAAWSACSSRWPCPSSRCTPRRSSPPGSARSAPAPPTHCPASSTSPPRCLSPPSTPAPATPPSSSCSPHSAPPEAW